MGYNYGNRFAVGNNGGRPPIYTDAVELHERVSEYFTYIEGESETKTGVKEDEEGNEVEYEYQEWKRHPERPTITGLALFLGFESKSTLYEYAKKDEFSYSIKRALAIVENVYEMGLDSRTPTGAIFALKNMGWIDKTHTENDNRNLNYDASKLTADQIKAFDRALENDF